jgi:hypothetical protein
LEIKGNRYQWLTPVILASQEAEFRKLQFKASPGKQKVLKTQSQKKTFTTKEKKRKKGLVEWLKM